MKTTIEIKKINENAVIPKYGTDFSAGADLYALTDETLMIAPGESLLIHTGISVAIPEGLVGLIFGRSGMACKRGLAPANKVGVIDSDYRGEIMVCLHNHGNVAQTVENGERIAQIAFLPYYTADFKLVDELDETVRGAGGFGSTGTK
jgi:dUTP pyrophosphatase